MSAIPPGTVFETCYVTNDIERAINLWANGIQAGPFFVFDMPAEFGVRLYRGQPAKDSIKAALGFCGRGFIEFVEPTNDAPSIFREVLESQGDMAVHHIFPRIGVTNAQQYDELFKKYTELGYDAALVMELPGLGRNALFDARKQLGVFVEILEQNEQNYKAFEGMYNAHINWDGKRPIREFAEVYTHMA